MSDNIYNPKIEEIKIYLKWQENKVGNPEQQTNIQQLKPKNQTHCILMPPPNLTGVMHAGHSFQHFLMDTLSRIHRQKGNLNLWFPGVDHAGIQLEGVFDKLIKKGEFDKEIEKELLKIESDKISKSKKNIPKSNLNIKNIIENKEDLPKFLKKNYPEIWLNLAWEKVNLWRDFQKEQAKILGDTPDYSRQLFTLDKKATNMVNYAFEKYWKDGLIYKNSYLVNWSVGLQTAVSDVFGEIEYEKRVDPFVTFEYQAKRFQIKKQELINDQKFQTFLGKYLKSLNQWPRLRLSTVRPETKFTDLAIAMHPKKFDLYFNLQLFDNLKNDFQILNAQKFLKAIKNYDIEIFYDLPALERNEVKLVFSKKVEANFGTGIVKIAPGHDLFDYNLYHEFVEKGILEPGKIQTCIGRDGKLNNFCKEFEGLTVLKSRPLIIKKLIETGYVPKKTELELIHLENESEVKEVLTNTEFEKLSIEKQYQYLEKLYPEYQIDWNYEHNVTICERTKTIIEPLISEEFFLSYHKKFYIK